MKQILLAIVLCAMTAHAAQAEIINAKQDTIQANALRTLFATADKTFPRLPNVYFRPSLKGECKADGGSNPYVLYYTSQRCIYMCMGVVDELGEGAAGYLLGHVYGHAAQVNYGVANIVLSTITKNRDRETELRGYVTQQVECVSGVLNSCAGLTVGWPRDWFEGEPLADSHCGRTPIAQGPVVSIGLSKRNTWFLKGQKSGDFNACSSGILPVDLLVDAAR